MYIYFWEVSPCPFLQPGLVLLRALFLNTLLGMFHVARVFLEFYITCEYYTVECLRHITNVLFMDAWNIF